MKQQGEVPPVREQTGDGAQQPAAGGSSQPDGELRTFLDTVLEIDFNGRSS